MTTWPETRRFLYGVLEWSTVAKGMLLLGILAPVFLQYAGWALYVLARPDHDQLVHVGFMFSQLPVFGGLALTAFALLMIGVLLRRVRRNPRWYEAACVLFFAVTLAYCGWLVGPLEMVAGFVLAGSPLVGFILFNRYIVLAAWLLVALSLLAVSIAAGEGWIAYAPLLVPPAPGDYAHARFWTLTHIFWALPHMLATFALAWFALGRWRERETAFRTLSLTDALTGAHNRRSVLDHLERELARAQRQGPPLSLLLVDLDFFKRVNDTWGHATGDRVLQAAARALTEAVRDYDIVGRWGGEEFLVVLPETEPAQATQLAERCRARLAALQVRADNGDLVPVTGSFGHVSNAGRLDLPVDTLVRLADEALYRAKQNGRNRIEVAE